MNIQKLRMEWEGNLLLKSEDARYHEPVLVVDGVELGTEVAEMLDMALHIPYERGGGYILRNGGNTKVRIRITAQVIGITEGTQVVYVPDQANGDTNHPDCEYGFVDHDMVIFSCAGCRFWNKRDKGGLRTFGDIGWVPVRNLILKDTVPQEQVEKALKSIVTALKETQS